MAYLDRVLLEGEIIVHRPRFSRFAAYGAPLVEFSAVALSWTVLRFLVIEFVFQGDEPPAPLFWVYVGGMLLMAGRFGWRMGVRFLNLTFSELAVTNRRYLEKEGVLDVSFWATDLEKVQRVEIEQPLLGRLFDYGDITIITVGEISHTTYAVARPIGLHQSLHARMTQADADRQIPSAGGPPMNQRPANERAAT